MQSRPIAPYAVCALADKPKTPRPPVQAPKRREEKKQGLSGLPVWAIVVGAIVLIGAVVGIVVAATGGGDSGGGSGNNAHVQAAMTAAGCTYKNVKPLPPKEPGNYHADSPTLTTKVKWATDPAVGRRPLLPLGGLGLLPRARNPRQVVHNEEHGGVIIWWGAKVPTSTVDQLEAFYREMPELDARHAVPELGNKIALTAWTGDPTKYYRDGDYGDGPHRDLPHVRRDGLQAFRDAFRGEGPEGIPESSNTPGSGPG